MMRKVTEKKTEDVERKAIRKALSDGQDLLLAVSLCVQGSSPLLERAFSATLQDLFCEVGGDLLFPVERMHTSRGTMALFLVRSGIKPDQMRGMFASFREHHSLGELMDFAFWKMEGKKLVSFDETGKPAGISFSDARKGLRAYVEAQ
jgi:hypothetical protein